MMKHLINWIEIPVHDLERAITFYDVVFGGITFHRMSLAEFDYAIFPTEDRFNCGALVKSEFARPTSDGITIYFDAQAGIPQILTLVKNAGGHVIMEKTFLSDDAGYIGMFLDSEGNKVGLQHL